MGLLAVDQVNASSTPHNSMVGNLADAAKQATKALKVVASTTTQVGELLARQYERVLQRISAVSQEIESLQADVMENITQQRARRTQLSEIEDDLEHAQMVGNAAIVAALYDELHVMHDETKREEALYRALCKTVRRRKETKKRFLQDRLVVEEAVRTFRHKQKLIQTLLATCSQQSASVACTLASSASQSDCGASILDDGDAEVTDESGDEDTSGSGSCPETENPVLDTPPLRAASPQLGSMETQSNPLSTPLRVRSWSSDGVLPLPPPRESVHTRARHSLSVHFASPVLTVSTIQTNDAQLDQELASLDLTHYLSSVNETTTSTVLNDTHSIQEEEATETVEPEAEPTLADEIAAVEQEVATVVETLVVQTEAMATSDVTTLAIVSELSTVTDATAAMV